MNKPFGFFLGFVIAGALVFQANVLAETVQGTITSIDKDAYSLEIVPPHGDTETPTFTAVRTAPGVRYVGVDSFDELQVGDYIEAETLSKSKTGGSAEATRIERQFVAAKNIYAPGYVQTQTTVTTTTVPATSVTTTTEPGTMVTTTTPGVVAETSAPVVVRTSETSDDGTHTKVTTTTY